MFVINAQAQRIVTVINAVPRNLAVVVKLIGEGRPDVPAAKAQESEQSAAIDETNGAALEAQQTSGVGEVQAEAAAETEAAQTEATPEIQQNSEETVEQASSQEDTAAAEEKSE